MPYKKITQNDTRTMINDKFQLAAQEEEENIENLFSCELGGEIIIAPNGHLMKFDAGESLLLCSHCYQAELERQLKVLL